MKPELKIVDVADIKLKDLGDNLSRRLFRTYINLPIAAKVTELKNRLSNLTSSDHSSNEFKSNVSNVGKTLTNLDLRPQDQSEDSYIKARENFKEKTIRDLFISLNFTNSLINSVNKHGTNPSQAMEREINGEDLSSFATTSKEDLNGSKTKLTNWENDIVHKVKVQKAIISRDLGARAKKWQE